MNWRPQRSEGTLMLGCLHRDSGAVAGTRSINLDPPRRPVTLAGYESSAKPTRRNPKALHEAAAKAVWILETDRTGHPFDIALGASDNRLRASSNRSRWTNAAGELLNSSLKRRENAAGKEIPSPPIARRKDHLPDGPPSRVPNRQSGCWPAPEISTARNIVPARPDVLDTPLTHVPRRVQPAGQSPPRSAQVIDRFPP